MGFRPLETDPLSAVIGPVKPLARGCSETALAVSSASASVKSLLDPGVCKKTRRAALGPFNLEPHLRFDGPSLPTHTFQQKPMECGFGDQSGPQASAAGV